MTNIVLSMLNEIFPSGNNVVVVFFLFCKNPNIESIRTDKILGLGMKIEKYFPFCFVFFYVLSYYPSSISMVNLGARKQNRKKNNKSSLRVCLVVFNFYSLKIINCSDWRRTKNHKWQCIKECVYMCVCLVQVYLTIWNEIQNCPKLYGNEQKKKNKNVCQTNLRKNAMNEMSITNVHHHWMTRWFFLERKKTKKKTKWTRINPIGSLDHSPVAAS